MKPLISFYVIACNQDNFIVDAVNGAFSQTWTPLEIVLSDDCSDDRTFEIMKKMANTYDGPHKIILNQNKKRLGVGAHINKILSLCTGDWIVASAGDDISVPERTEKLFNYWLSHGKRATLVYSNIIEMHEHGLPLCQRDFRKEVPGGWTNDVIFWDYNSRLQQKTPPVHGAAFGYPRQTFFDFGPLWEGVVFEDNVLNWRAELTGGVLLCPDYLVRHRNHPEQLTNLYSKTALLNANNRRRTLKWSNLKSLQQNLSDLILVMNKGLINKEEYEALKNNRTTQLLHEQTEYDLYWSSLGKRWKILLHNWKSILGENNISHILFAALPRPIYLAILRLNIFIKDILDTPKVHASNSVHVLTEYAQARNAVYSFDKKSIPSLFSRVLIYLIVLLANIYIVFSKFILFKKNNLLKYDFKNIVIYTVGIVGDNVVLLPAIAAIRQRYKDANITVISNCQIWAESGAKEVLGPSRFKDKLIIIKDYPIERKGFKLVYNRHLFHDVKCDLFINLSPFGNRGWIGAVIKEMIFAYKLGATHAVGFHIASYSRKNWFNSIKHYFVKNEPRRSRRILKELKLEPIENEDLFERDDTAKESLIKKLQAQNWQNEPLYVMNPGAKFMSKCWPAERFGQLAKHISEKYGDLSVIIGISAEKSIAEVVENNAGVKIINLAGLTSIQEAVELLRMAKACITNDTGIMHIAAMIGVPTVAIFSTRHSPTDWFPLGKNILSLFTLPECRFCYNDDCPAPVCIQSIRADDVIINMSAFVDSVKES